MLFYKNQPELVKRKVCCDFIIIYMIETRFKVPLYMILRFYMIWVISFRDYKIDENQKVLTTTLSIRVLFYSGKI